MFELTGKTAIVTGARRGIGKGIALAFATQGANVVVADVSKADCELVCAEIKTLGVKGVKTLAVECDVSKKTNVDALVATAVKTFGRLDIMVNNAGILSYSPIVDFTEELISKILDVNLKGAIWGVSAAARQFQKQGGPGKIVTVDSIAALVGYPQLAHYCASKGGIAAFTRAAALELASSKINVNAIAPGGVDTPMTEGLMKDPAARKAAESAVPWGRFGVPADIAAAAVFLASQESDYVTGHILVVDGGSTAQ